MTAPSGSIISPNFPRRYDRNADCAWRISIAEGSKIELNILELFIEYHSNCEVDYVEVSFLGLSDDKKSTQIIYIHNTDKTFR